MLGMSFLSFLILTFIGAVVAATYHYVFRYRFLDGNDAVIGKLIIGCGASIQSARGTDSDVDHRKRLG